MKWELLDGLGDTEVQALLSIARRRKFARGEVVFHEHDPADTLHLVDKGRFAVRVATPLGDTAILSILGPGDMFGELSLLGDADARRSATVAALEAGETRSVHRLDFERLRSTHPETAAVLISILSGQVRRLSRHLLEALYVPADKRVLRRLLELGGSTPTATRPSSPSRRRTSRAWRARRARRSTGSCARRRRGAP